MGEFSDFALVPEQGVVPQMDQLDGAMQSRIRELAARIDPGDSAAVLGFGARAQKEMGAFSDIALSRMLSRDVQPLSGALSEMAQQIRSCCLPAQTKGLLRRMLGKAASLGEMREAYEKAAPRIDALANEMTDRRVALMRDSALLDRIYERNEALYRELCSLLVVGGEAVRQAKERGADAQQIARLERRVEDIRVTQLASTQLAAQIRMMQSADRATCEKLKSAVEVTLPLWKGQAAAALGLARATESMDMARRAGSEAARGIRSGAKELSAQKKALADAANAGGEADRDCAQQTAKALLDELEEIERGLKAQNMTQSV